MLDKQELEKRKKVTANLIEQLMDSIIQLNRETYLTTFDAQDIKRMAYKDFNSMEIQEFWKVFTSVMSKDI